MTWRKLTAGALILSIVGAYFYLSPDAETDLPLMEDPQELVGAANVDIRQEVNILNRYFGTTAGNAATSSELIYIDPAKYSGTVTYYLEIVASTSVSVSDDVYLKNSAGTIVCTANIPLLTTSMTLIRGSACTAPSSADVYRLVIAPPTLADVSIKSARVVILQSFADSTVNATSTQTQIEIGSYINASTSVLSSPAANPKYWTYASTAWNGVKTFSVQATFSNTFSATASTTLYTTSGTRTYVVSTGTAYTVIDAWGAGGAGFDGSNSGGGAGGGGGAFASSSIIYAVGTSISHTVGAGGGTSGANGANTTFNSTDVVADAGEGGTSATTGEGVAGSEANSTGQLENAGGLGGSGNSGDDGGGGGGGAGGPLGDGSPGVDASATAGGDGGDGNGGNTTGAGLGGNGGACSAGTSNAGGGEGGGGADQAAVGCAGGSPGAGGGGGETGQGNGQAGQLRITEIKGVVNAILQEDDGAFGTWTNKVAVIVNGFSTSTGKMASSSSFSPTDGRHYRLVASTTGSGATYSIFNAKIVVDQNTIAGSESLTDSWPTSNWVANAQTINYGFLGGTFTAASGALTKVEMYLTRQATATGTLWGVIYAATNGTCPIATSSNPGTVLATSTNSFDVSTLPTSGSPAVFTFTFGPSPELTLGNCYATGFWYANTGSRVMELMTDTAAPTSTSMSVINRNTSTGNFSVSLSNSPIMYVYQTPVSPLTKLEPQYLLANTSLNSGTALQNSLTKWDSAEWDTGNQLYYHQADAADNSTSIVTINEAGGTLVTDSTVTSPDNMGTSTCMTMPSSGNLDMTATTNNGDVYASRILVRVNTAGGQTCTPAGGGGGNATSSPQSEFWFE